MPATHEPAELPLLETLAAAPDAGIAEGRLEATTLILYVEDALASPTELEVYLDDGAPQCDALLDGLFSAYGRGLVERAGSTWHLSARGRAALSEAQIEPTAEAQVLVAETLDTPIADLLTEVAEKLSSRYAMIAAGDGQPLRV